MTPSWASFGCPRGSVQGPALSIGMGTWEQQKATGEHGQFGELPKHGNRGVDLACGVPELVEMRADKIHVGYGVDLADVIREFGDSDIDLADLASAEDEMAEVFGVETDETATVILHTSHGTWGVPADRKLDVLPMGPGFATFSEDGVTWLSASAADPRKGSAEAARIAGLATGQGRFAVVTGESTRGVAEFQVREFDTAGEARDWAAQNGLELDVDDRALSEDGVELRLYSPGPKQPNVDYAGVVQRARENWHGGA